MQDLYSIELARRGYVVLALDLHSHGDSESLSIAELYDGAVGVDGAVQLIASLPYVDTQLVLALQAIPAAVQLLIWR